MPWLSMAGRRLANGRPSPKYRSAGLLENRWRSIHIATRLVKDPEIMFGRAISRQVAGTRQR